MTDPSEADELLAELERQHAATTAQLESANAELRAFAYSVSHDLRAPLRAMRGFAEALREDYADQLDDVGRDYTDRIVAASERLDAMIRDLLEYSRVGRDRLQLRSVPLLPLLPLLQEAASLADLHGQRPPTVAVEATDRAVRGHRPTLSRVLENLVANAAKFVVPGQAAQIRLRAVPRDGAVRVEVADAGIGIDPEHVERVFGVFERLHNRDEYPGTGIGLAIVRRGIERQGGRVGGHSVLGEGTTVWFELPQATA